MKKKNCTFLSLLHVCYLATQSPSGYKSTMYIILPDSEVSSSEWKLSHRELRFYTSVHVQCTSVNCLLLINFRFVKGKALTESLQFATENKRYQTMQQTNQTFPRGKRRDLIRTERNQMPQLLGIQNEWLNNLINLSNISLFV